MNLTMKLQEVHAISNAFALFQGKQKPKLMFAIKQNQEKISKIVQAIHDQYQDVLPESYKEYEKRREAIFNKHRAEMKMEVNDFDFGDKTAEIEKEVMEMADNYKEAIEDYQKAMKEFDELLQEDVDVNLQPIKIDHLPKKMALSTFEALKPIIKDVYQFEKYQITKIDISKFKIFRTVSMLGEMIQMGVPFPTKVVHRLSYFTANYKEIALEVIKKRQEHARIPEFAEYQKKKNAIINNTELEASVSKIQLEELDASVPKEVLESAKGAEGEMNDIATDIVQIDVPLIDINTLDDELDEQIFSMLLPLIDSKSMDQ